MRLSQTEPFLDLRLFAQSRIVKRRRLGARPMDLSPRDELHRELEQADRHIAEGRAHIANQTALIAELERDGHDTASAKELLATLHQSQQMHEDHRALIVRELKA